MKFKIMVTWKGGKSMKRDDRFKSRNEAIEFAKRWLKDMGVESVEVFWYNGKFAWPTYYEHVGGARVSA